METFTITKIREDNVERTKDSVASEVPFTLIMAGEELVTISCSPSNLDDLVRGFLFTSGLIKRITEIKRIVINNEQWTARVDLNDAQRKDLVFKRLYTSGCGRGTLFYNADDIMYRAKLISDFRIKRSGISALMAAFQRKSALYLKTGGVHSAALMDRKGILVFREDIGRHNAIDKVIGQMLLRKGHFGNKILASSGRISSEVFFKSRKCGIPLIISRSAPTDQAVRFSREMGVTLVCFARGNRMNIYSGRERIMV